MAAHDAGEIYLGVIDAIVTIGVTLCAKGLLTRDELAAAFDATALQHREQGVPHSRRIAVAAIGEFFKIAVRGERRFAVIDGGQKTTRWRGQNRSVT
jgi:hypothetical protein